MDNDTNLSEVRSSERPVHDLSDIGIKRLTPINPNGYPRMQWLWDHLQTQTYAFDDFSRGKIDVFAMSLLDAGSLHFEVGDHGYAVVRNLLYSDNAAIHYCIWDKDYPFREVLQDGRELIDFLFKTVKVHRVTANVPEYNKQAVQFATLLGFHYEGLIREAVVWYEKHYDIKVYGLLRDHWFKHKFAQLRKET